jgi:hypothetical protein
MTTSQVKPLNQPPADNGNSGNKSTLSSAMASDPAQEPIVPSLERLASIELIRQHASALRQVDQLKQELKRSQEDLEVWSRSAHKLEELSQQYCALWEQEVKAHKETIRRQPPLNVREDPKYALMYEMMPDVAHQAWELKRAQELERRGFGRRAHWADFC